MTAAQFPVCLLLLVLLLLISGPAKVESCYVQAIGGGCPDVNACAETCRPCYRGVGLVYAYCVAPGGGIYWWSCRCDFQRGAPCPPRGPPACPKPGGNRHQVDEDMKNSTRS